MQSIHPKNIIVRMPNWVGDLVMATPILEDLRRAFPKAKITAMCIESICQLLEKDDRIDELFRFKKIPLFFARRQERRNVLQKLHLGKYDTGILLTNTFSSAWLFWIARIPIRIGYAKHFRRVLLTHPMKYPERGHQIERYKKLLAPLGIGICNTLPNIYLADKEISDAKELLYQRGYKEGRKLVGINPTSAYGPAKCWPKENFRKAAVELLSDPNLYLLFFGQSSDDLLIKQICEGLDPRAVDLAGVTTLRELAALIKNCDLLLTNDSGPMHIACAVQTPVVALFGSTDPEISGPYGERSTTIYKNLSCSPCGKRVCPIHFPCMKEISVKEVVQAIQQKLKS